MQILESAPERPVGFETLRWSTPGMAPALTVAAALGGLLEVLFERVAGPVLTHAAGPSAAPAAALVSRLGGLLVAVTAVLVLLAAVAWTGVVRAEHPVVAGSVLSTVVMAVIAAGFGSTSALALLHLSVVVAAIGIALVLRLSGLPGTAVVAVVVAIVAGQWSLAGGIGAVAARVVAETALVLALFLLAATVANGPRRRSVLGLTAGALIATAALMSTRTPLVVLWAAGATLWMPSVVYIAAGAAVGLLLANWLPDRATRHLAAGLVLLAVAGIEPALVHHSLTALVALLALTAPAAGRMR